MTKISCPDHGPMSDGEVLDAAREVSGALYNLAMEKGMCSRKLFLAGLVAHMAYKLQLDEFKDKDPSYPILDLGLHMAEAGRLAVMYVEDVKNAKAEAQSPIPGVTVIALDPNNIGELHDFLSELFGEDPKGKKH